jgi:hypothetical protein
MGPSPTAVHARVVPGVSLPKNIIALAVSYELGKLGSHTDAAWPQMFHMKVAFVVGSVYVYAVGPCSVSGDKSATHGSA